jgi:hypothetical protein
MTLLTAVGLVALAFALALIGGAVTGTRIAGEFLGKELAAMMGAFFGPASVLPAAILAVAVFAWFN